MIIFENLSYITRSDMPDSDLTGEAKYIVEDGTDLANKILSCANGFTPVEDNDGNLIDVVPNEKPKPTLSQAITNKSSEINTACENTIVAGVDYQSLAGLQHYSLTAYDQTNIMALASEAKQGKSVPYHANGEICRFYEPQEFLGLVATVTCCITYNTTYANLLKHQVAAMTNVDDVLAVWYGTTPLTPEYQARLDEIMEALQNAEATS